MCVWGGVPSRYPNMAVVGLCSSHSSVDIVSRSQTGASIIPSAVVHVNNIHD